MVINAAKAAGIQPIDSVFSNIDDMESLANTARESKSLGFAGMGCIHPRQVSIINQNFLPDDEEILKAQRIVCAFEKAEKEGIGVVVIDSKMIDPPVVKRALRIIRQALQSGKIEQNWRKAYEN
jgi:citrate lyase subunit beta/citryl-CoA lyase